MMSLYKRPHLFYQLLLSTVVCLEVLGLNPGLISRFVVVSQYDQNLFNTKWDTNVFSHSLNSDSLTIEIFSYIYKENRLYGKISV